MMGSFSEHHGVRSIPAVACVILLTAKCCSAAAWTDHICLSRLSLVKSKEDPSWSLQETIPPSHLPDQTSP